MTDWLVQILVDSTHEHMPQKIFYRLYHDDQGQPLFYSMEDLPGRYIEIDAKTHAEGRYDIRVIDGRIKRNLNSSNLPRKLVPDDQGTPCHPDDVMIVDPTGDRYWTVKIYED